MSNEAPSAQNFKFPKSERLHSKKVIQSLFDKGDSFFCYPFKILHLPQPSADQNHQVLISASSKRFKRAVDRNLIKRRIREAYRLNKHLLEGIVPATLKLSIAYIYVGKEIHPFELIQSKLKETLLRLKSEYNKNNFL